MTAIQWVVIKCMPCNAMDETQRMNECNATDAMQWLQCNDYNAIHAFDTMQWLQYNDWNTMDAIQWLQCNGHNATDAIQLIAM